MDKGRFNVTSVEKNGIQNGISLITKPLNGGTDNGSYTPDTWLHDAGWRRKKSLAQLTREALPRMENYRNSKRALKRPSLGELHGEIAISEEDERQRETKSPTPGEHGGIKLGWIQGVLIPCLLNIWGVMLFLRVSWVVAQAGIGYSLIIILISAVVCIITTLSMSAISTNGEVKGGGIYYIISRSLGPEMGASVGIIFAFANAVAASMNTIGFCDSLNDLLKTYGLKIIDNSINDTRIVGTLALIVMCVICAIGMEWESKAQNFLIAIIVIAILDFVIGTCMGPMSEEAVAQGFIGLSTKTTVSNFNPDFRSEDFFSVFAIFFPSVTGIQAGANISGDLKDPASAIPKGTMLALLISMASYVMMVLFAGAGAARDASGNITENAAIMMNSANLSCIPDCQYGLHNNFAIMQLMSAWGPFIYAGCFAATLSTALTNLLSVPRLIQALGVDRIYPGLIYFSKGYGKAGEPYRGYVLTFIVSLVFLLIANLNTIAPLITNFYLTSYALINFCTFHAALIKPLGWRPTFRYYNVWLSLSGFLMCVAIMFLINWITSLITFAIFFALYLIVHYRNPDVNWGSSTQAQTYKTALSSAFNLAKTGEHVKNYCPQLLVLSGAAHSRPPLVDLAHHISKGAGSLMIVAEISQNRISYRERDARARSGMEWLRERKVRAFPTGVYGFDFEQGARALMQATGIGRLAPNVLLMGYKGNWATAPHSELVSYFNVLHAAFETRLAVAIVRVQGGLDYSEITHPALACRKPAGTSLTGASSGELRVLKDRIMHADSDLNIAGNNLENGKNGDHVLTMQKSATICSGMKNMDIKDVRDIIYKGPDGSEVSKETLTNMSIFQKKKVNKLGLQTLLDLQLATFLASNVMYYFYSEMSVELFLTNSYVLYQKGTLDVWWLYDDGGLTILLPYILSQRSLYSDCKLRIFALANRRHEMELEERNMANLLSKFRLDYSSLKMVHDITDMPKQETTDLFNSIIHDFKESNNSNEECRITDLELMTLQEKTNRQLRLRELLIQNSSEADLVVISLPMPRKGSVSAPLYMAWLEIMSRDMPPVLFVRGNQTSVLTFYS